MIDEFFLGGSSCTCGLPERLEVEPVDSVLAMAAQAMGASFFDDCAAMAGESGAESTNFAVTGLFKLLGVHYAREVPKAPVFAAVFSCIGVVVDLNNFQDGSITVMHTEQRVLELKETLSLILSCGTLDREDAEQRSGRMMWFSSFVFGGRPNRSVAALSAIGSGASRPSLLTEEHQLALHSLLE